jgi:ribosomal protection tetracycline resistance protein
LVRTLNLGILAHVDAGKTSLTERLLFAAGVIDEVGSVDDGSTQTDSLALERQRGITIRSAVVSFVIGDVTVNLIDTPGHPDFIAEVERVLSVLDGAVLVISAVEGVQAQTRVLLRALQRLRIPALIFVNKIDRGGARDEGTLQAIREKLTPAIIAMGSARELGTRRAAFAPYGAGDRDFTAGLAELLAEHDDALLVAYVDDETTIPYERLRGALAAQAGRAQIYPVFLGSAMTGAGVDALTAGIRELLPTADGAADAPASGTVFKIERGPAGEKVAYIRMFSGQIRARDRLRFGRAQEDRDQEDRDQEDRHREDRHREDRDQEDRHREDQHQEDKVTSVSVFRRGGAVPSGSVAAGQIGTLRGLRDIQIGDTLGVPRTGPALRHFAPPTLETVIVPRHPADKGALHVALAQLAEQDPLINLRQDDLRQEMYVSLYGEVQKEVILATLASDFGIDVAFRETTTICIERPIGTGAAAEIIGKTSDVFAATVGLRIEPAAISSGAAFRLEVELGSLPLSFHKAVEETVHETLRQGLHGWQVTDCTVTMTHSGYMSPVSTASDFRNLTPLVLMAALQQAGTRVHEPMDHFRLEAPADTLGAILPVLARLRAVPRIPALRGSSFLLEGEIPAARVNELQQDLPALTRGEGLLDCAFDSYQPVRGKIPARPRSDNNPLNREEYLLHIVRRVGRGPDNAEQP